MNISHFSSSITLLVTTWPFDVRRHIVVIEHSVIIIPISYSQFFIKICLKKIFQKFGILHPRYPVHTCIREQVFSTVKIDISKTRSRITDEHLRAVLRINSSRLEPDIDVLCEQKQGQHQRNKYLYILFFFSFITVGA